MSNVGEYCSQCGKWFADPGTKEYDVVLDDGEYPATPLCDECADETALDAISIKPTAD